MIRKVFEVKVNYPENGYVDTGVIPTLELLIPVSQGIYPNGVLNKRPTVLILPGGAYSGLAEIEADPIAIGFMNEGFNCAVLRYSVAPAVFPMALCEVATAVMMLKNMSKEYGIDEDNIFVCGFSAGGHLCASYGVFWNSDFLSEALGTDSKQYKAKGMILGYPVLVSHGKYHKGTFDNILANKRDDAAARDFLSLEKHVTKDTLPAFIMHTYEDAAVDCSGSLLFASALKENDVPFDLHIYRYGKHGISTGGPVVFKKSRVSNWIKMAAEWMLDIE